MEAKGNILLTGYEAFGDFKVNPSIAACERLEGRVFKGFKVVVEEIPMRFDDVRNIIEGHMERHKPVAVVFTGVTGAGAQIAVERVAINVFSARERIMGTDSLDRPLREGGPVAYFTKLPFRLLLERLKEAKIPSILSNSAGTVGCNQIFYYLMDYLAREGIDIPAGFIHIPRLPEQALGFRAPSMTLNLSARAMEVVVEAISELL